jgi:predicted nucleic acid-binding protein
MRVVLDVSAAFAIVTNSPGGEKLADIISQANIVFAPDLFYSEATNVGWKYHHIEEASREASFRLTEKAIQLVDIFFPSESIWEDALDLACQLEHPVYDCFYLVLAQQQDATLLTKDKRLIRLAKKIDLAVVEC